MSDLFHEKVSNLWLDRMFAVMALAGRHTFQCLTKRAERMRDYCNDPETRRRVGIVMLDLIKEGEFDVPNGMIVPLERCPDSTNEKPAFWSVWPLPNIWMGVSAEDQKTADERIPLLLQTPAAIHWVSYEPALGPVDFTNLSPPNFINAFGHSFGLPSLDWIVVGGESGPEARPFNVQWARDTIAQCKAAGVACFVKQLGANPGQERDTKGDWHSWKLLDRKGGDIEDWPKDLQIREYPQLKQETP